jgi:hypothetical protein
MHETIGDIARPYEPPKLKPVMKFVRVELLGGDPFHRLRPGSSLTLLGMIEQVRGLIKSKHEYCDSLELRGRARVFIGDVSYDKHLPDSTHSTQGLDIWYFPIGIAVGYLDGKEVYHGLILVPTGKRKDEYRRIGLFVARDHSREDLRNLPPNIEVEEIIFDHHKLKEITIV